MLSLTRVESCAAEYGALQTLHDAMLHRWPNKPRHGWRQHERIGARRGCPWVLQGWHASAQLLVKQDERHLQKEKGRPVPVPAFREVPRDESAFSATIGRWKPTRSTTGAWHRWRQSMPWCPAALPDGPGASPGIPWSAARTAPRAASPRCRCSIVRPKTRLGISRQMGWQRTTSSARRG